MQGFRSPGSARRFPSTQATVYNHFTTRRNLIHRALRDRAFMDRREAVGAAAKFLLPLVCGLSLSIMPVNDSPGIKKRLTFTA